MLKSTGYIISITVVCVIINDQQIIHVMTIYSLKEASSYLSISEQTLYRYIKNKNFPARKIGKQWRIHKDSLDSWLKLENASAFLPENVESNIIELNNNNLKYIDLFCGIGGFHQAGLNNGMSCVFASDNDKFAQETYESWYGMRPHGDITEFTKNESSLKLIPDFDVLFAGFPCQPFSYAGKGEGFEDKTRGTLFFHVAKIIKNKKPKMFLLENVKGLKSHNKGETLKLIKETLINLGYVIYDDVLNSYDFGVPQSRERWFCVGFRSDLNVNEFEFTKGTGVKTTISDILEKYPSKNDAPAIPNFEMERIKYHFENMHKFPDGRVMHDNSKYGINTKKGRHGVYSFLKKDKTLRFHIGDVAKTQIQEAYYVHKDTFSPAIIANRRPKLWDLGRFLSVKECMALQAFPLELEFPVSNAQALKQLGNSVCVKVIDSIVKDMIKTLHSAEKMSLNRIKSAC